MQLNTPKIKININKTQNYLLRKLNINEYIEGWVRIEALKKA
ncbi:hypothetical protein CHPC1041_0032 [Streptococcus phage CHPC1041]|uniref:Uncharacterized protein n=1 Tax=Streptococcus phage CHPC1041 TaxID=2365015 RepID=A0A3G8FCB7_9CAUD|nr:hypothetical protein PP199_gp32 [Streptococcus phage CHPC1041]AZF91490.1 hypothetical protein CHPC1041_0032 [Streptococcus phage CHPC1041]